PLCVVVRPFTLRHAFPPDRVTPGRPGEIAVVVPACRAGVVPRCCRDDTRKGGVDNKYPLLRPKCDHLWPPVTIQCAWRHLPRGHTLSLTTFPAAVEGRPCASGEP